MQGGAYPPRRPAAGGPPSVPSAQHPPLPYNGAVSSSTRAPSSTGTMYTGRQSQSRAASEVSGSVGSEAGARDDDHKRHLRRSLASLCSLALVPCDDDPRREPTAQPLKELCVFRFCLT